MLKITITRPIAVLRSTEPKKKIVLGIVSVYLASVICAILYRSNGWTDFKWCRLVCGQGSDHIL